MQLLLLFSPQAGHARRLRPGRARFVLCLLAAKAWAERPPSSAAAPPLSSTSTRNGCPDRRHPAQPSTTPTSSLSLSPEPAELEQLDLARTRALTLSASLVSPPAQGDQRHQGVPHHRPAQGRFVYVLDQRSGGSGRAAGVRPGMELRAGGSDGDARLEEARSRHRS
jgi:hypothetical protein